MKTKKFKFKKLLNLHLLKFRAYEHSIKKINFNDLITANLDQIIIGIKRALQVIFQYHQANKRILFVGLPSKLEHKINLSTRHAAIAGSFNVKGLISNSTANSELNVKSFTCKSIKQNPALLALKLTKTPDLIVLVDYNNSFSVLSEAWVARVPVINFTAIDSHRDSFIQSTYLVSGNFKSILSAFDKNIFFIGLNFLFKNLKKKQKSVSSNRSKFNPKFSAKNRKRLGRENR